MRPQPTLGGLPLERWLRRPIQLHPRRGPKGGAHALPAVLVDIIPPGRRVVVRPRGHRCDETVDLRDIRPWWSKNPDLKQKADALCKT